MAGDGSTPCPTNKTTGRSTLESLPASAVAPRAPSPTSRWKVLSAGFAAGLIVLMVGLQLEIDMSFVEPAGPMASYALETSSTLLFKAVGAFGGCAADSKGYRELRCPVWDPAKSMEKQKDVLDWRLRYVYKRQHPSNCSAANYLLEEDLDKDLGFGAIMRGFLTGGFWNALQSDRVFLSHPDKFFYANCPSKSWECYFEPVSNCTYDEHVASLPRGDNWTDDSHRAVNVSGWTWPNIPKVKPFKDLMQIGTDDHLLLAGVYLYALRPNVQAKRKVESVLRDAIPCDHDPLRTIALPIRGSDKCKGEMHSEVGEGSPHFKDGEATCLSFGEYMKVAELLRENDPTLDTIVLTSEDRRYLDWRHNYTDQWKFVTNPHDLMPGTGYGALMVEGAGGDKTVEDVFYSFYTSLQLTMRAKYWVLNCASNFHMLVRMLVEWGGCHFVNKPVIICLDEQLPSTFRICNMFAGDFNACMESREKILKGSVRRQLRSATEEEYSEAV